MHIKFNAPSTKFSFLLLCLILSPALSDTNAKIVSKTKASLLARPLFADYGVLNEIISIGSDAPILGPWLVVLFE